MNATGEIQVEHPRDVETHFDAPLTPVVGGVEQEIVLDNPRGIGQGQVEHVSTGFHFDSYTQGVLKAPLAVVPTVIRGDVGVIGDDGHALGEFDPRRATHGNNGVGVLTAVVFDGQILVDVRRQQFQRKSFAKFPCDDQLVQVVHSVGVTPLTGDTSVKSA